MSQSQEFSSKTLSRSLSLTHDDAQLITHTILLSERDSSCLDEGTTPNQVSTGSIRKCVVRALRLLGDGSSCVPIRIPKCHRVAGLLPVNKKAETSDYIIMRPFTNESQMVLLKNEASDSRAAALEGFCKKARVYRCVASWSITEPQSLSGLQQYSTGDGVSQLREHQREGVQPHFQPGEGFFVQLAKPGQERMFLRALRVSSPQGPLQECELVARPEAFFVGGAESVLVWKKRTADLKSLLASKRFSRLRADFRCRPVKFVQMAEALCRAVRSLHSSKQKLAPTWGQEGVVRNGRGLVHTDLKLENVLFVCREEETHTHTLTPQRGGEAAGKSLEADREREAVASPGASTAVDSGNSQFPSCRCDHTPSPGSLSAYSNGSASGSGGSRGSRENTLTVDSSSSGRMSNRGRSGLGCGVHCKQLSVSADECLGPLPESHVYEFELTDFDGIVEEGYPFEGNATPGYISPAQVAALKDKAREGDYLARKADDVWALGVTLRRLFDGLFPHALAEPSPSTSSSSSASGGGSSEARRRGKRNRKQAVGELADEIRTALKGMLSEAEKDRWTAVEVHGFFLSLLTRCGVSPITSGQASASGFSRTRTSRVSGPADQESGKQGQETAAFTHVWRRGSEPGITPPLSLPLPLQVPAVARSPVFSPSVPSSQAPSTNPQPSRLPLPPSAEDQRKVSGKATLTSLLLASGGSEQFDLAIEAFLRDEELAEAAIRRQQDEQEEVSGEGGEQAEVAGGGAWRRGSLASLLGAHSITKSVEATAKENIDEGVRVALPRVKQQTQPPKQQQPTGIGSVPLHAVPVPAVCNVEKSDKEETPKVISPSEAPSLSSGLSAVAKEFWGESGSPRPAWDLLTRSPLADGPLPSPPQPTPAPALQVPSQTNGGHQNSTPSEDPSSVPNEEAEKGKEKRGSWGGFWSNVFPSRGRGA
uniref:Protein kinase domain-containing protein n=1 Tax=Chromera velia CCMP2878 TaxID=1169474 RepID=A0A0G4GLK6_9ALVE|eukprot:Cvel_22435.t1-p1 / transcript=Cvel_22435.t1 / gene=Cvel_22435 / organism=Chromera_velia_CCMP2878 / gene_product=hypothetical protein / transcript_product=hypothetical protein / location=Cvel_scaffold2204:8209-11697(-) / protein_length=936 / sequence_SO=supercontig / SO=protein_coding / is_pseudo=false